MEYKQLTAADRKAIEVLLSRKCTPTEIAGVLGVDPSTVCREIKRRSAPQGYFADIAQVDYEQCRQRSRRKTRMSDPLLVSYVVSRIRRGWSPEVIVGRMGLEDQPFSVSHETIYHWIYTDELCVKDHLYQYLRYGRKKRQKWRGRKSQTEKIPNRVSIHARPGEIESRSTIGHWEADSVLYTGRQAITTMNERKTSYVVFTKVERKTAALTGVALTNAIRKNLVLSITVDNGQEFMLHEHVTGQTGVPMYFCDPYTSWQRGANEQSNMLLRGYLPKRTSIEKVSQEEIDDIAWELNNRPRKRLGWYTPAEVYRRELANLNQKLPVALEVRI